MGYVAYMRKGDKFIKVVTSQEFGLRKSQGFKLTVKEEYERANADALPVLPGSPLDERLSAPPHEPATADAGAEVAVDSVDDTPINERLENYRAIFHDVIAGHLTSTPMVQAEHGLYLLKHIADLQAKLAAAEAARDAAVAAGYVWKQAAKTHRKFGLQMAQRVEDAEQGWHDEVTSKYE